MLLFSARLLLCGFCFTCLVSCHPVEPYQTERFDLIAGPCAAEGYPMEVVEGHFGTSDGKRFPVAGGFLEGDWGTSLGSYVSGDGTAPAPDSLELRWFSYAEDKFYGGRFALPQRRIHDLLKQGYWDTDKKQHDTYNELTVCMLPKGAIVLWLAGQNQVLLGRYAGREIAYDFKRFNEAANRPLMIQQERAKMPPHVQEEIRNNTLTPRQWDAYLTTYSWRLEVVVGADKQQASPIFYDYFARYFNAEKASYPPDTHKWAVYLDGLVKSSPKPVPKIIGVFVRNQYGERHEIRVDPFDEAETLAAFQTLAASHPKEPIVLRVAVDKLYTRATLTLSTGFQTLPLPKATVKLFEKR